MAKINQADDIFEVIARLERRIWKLEHPGLTNPDNDSGTAGGLRLYDQSDGDVISGGGRLYTVNGALWFVGSSGTKTQIAPA